MRTDDDVFRELQKPFRQDQLKTRPQGGRQLTYITARTAMNRFDEAVGPANWSNRFYEVCDCLACEITVTLPSGRVVSKSDGGGFKTMTEKTKGGEVVEDEENTDKTGFSDAFKRAAVMFGVGRYLYKDGVAQLGDPEPPQSTPSPRKTDERTFREFVLDAVGHCNRTLQTDAAEKGVELDGSKLMAVPDLEKRLHAWCASSGLRPKNDDRAPVSAEKREALLAELYQVHGKAMRAEIRRLVELWIKNGLELVAEMAGKGDAYEHAV